MQDFPYTMGPGINQDKYEGSFSIPETYEKSRDRFRASLAAVRDLWPAARLDDYKLASMEGLSIDWISTQATLKKEKRFILTTGEHGIEGYVGSAMLQLFIEKYLPRFNPKTTGILLVHAINPWGMKHHRRVNEYNVDLNRSFVADYSSLKTFNPDYDRLSPTLNPEEPLRRILALKFTFLVQAVKSTLGFGMTNLREAVLKGQYRHPRGIYFGGQSRPEETRLVMDLYESAIDGYAHLVALDMHTGYGPRYQMTLVNSAQEKRTSLETADRFRVPRVAAANPQEFYSIQGDMIEYLYTLMKTKYPGMPFYATSFEFGTFGDSLGATLRAMRTTVFENQLYWNGGSQAAHEWMSHEYDEMFAPSASDWFEKAVSDARQAFEGILTAEGYVD